MEPRLPNIFHVPGASCGNTLQLDTLFLGPPGCGVRIDASNFQMMLSAMDTLDKKIKDQNTEIIKLKSLYKSTLSELEHTRMALTYHPTGNIAADACRDWEKHLSDESMKN